MLEKAKGKEGRDSTIHALSHTHTHNFWKFNANKKKSETNLGTSTVEQQSCKGGLGNEKTSSYAYSFLANFELYYIVCLKLWT